MNSNQENVKKTTPKQVKIKFLKNSEKETILNAAKEKKKSWRQVSCEITKTKTKEAGGGGGIYLKLLEMFGKVLKEINFTASSVH